MSKLIKKIDDELLKAERKLASNDSLTLIPMFKRRVAVLRAFKAFVEDAMEDLDEESFSEYEQNALAVWEDE